MKNALLVGSSLLALSAVSAHAGEAAAPSAPVVAEATVGEIVITSRKREERLLDAPLSISAVSAKKIDDLQLKGLVDISKTTPGFKFEQASFSAGYRFLGQVRFRGMASFNPRPNNQVGATFVDGSFVAAGSASLNTDDVERVEVIKGPQNAYFGRNTFAGAVNFVTRTPGEAFKGSARVKLETDNGYDVGGSVEGAIIPGLLTGRLMLNSFQVGGQYKSGDGSDIGRQTTKGATGTLYFTPGERLRVRLRGNYQRDEDFGNLTQVYSGANGNCQLGSVPYFCGGLPTNGETYTQLNGAPFTVTRNMVFQDTTLTPPALIAAGRPNALRDLLSNINGASNDVSFLSKIPTIDHFGSKSENFRGTSVADYDLGGGWTLSGIFGYGEYRFVSLRDNDGVLGFAPTLVSCAPLQTQACRLNATTFAVVPFWTRDLSSEARVATPVDKPLRAMLGVSYFKQKIDGNLTGGGKTLSAGTGAITPFVNNDRDRSHAVGVFGSVSYDVLHNLTLDLEGRYQVDSSRQFTQTAVNVYSPVSADFKDFLPRVILTYKPMRETTLYGSWSIGALTGVANTQFNNLIVRVANSPRGNIFGTTNQDTVRKGITALLNFPGVAPEVVPAEKIVHYELGWKQSFLDGRGAFTLAGYHIKWTNMKSTAALNGVDLDLDGVADAIGPTLPASSRIWGAEFTLDLQPIDGLNLGLAGDYVNHRFTDFIIYGSPATLASRTTPISGNGTTLYQYPNYSLSGTVRYTHQLTSNIDGYVGGEVSFIGKQYIDEANLAFLKPFHTVNLRAGLIRDKFKLEAYVNNLFNYDGPTGGRRGTASDGFAGVTTFPGRLRTVGVRASVDF